MALVTPTRPVNGALGRPAPPAPPSETPPDGQPSRDRRWIAFAAVLALALSTAGFAVALGVAFGNGHTTTLVTQGPGASTSGMAPGTGSATDAVIDTSAKPSSTWTARDPSAPALPGGTVHNVTFDMTEATLQVAPGVTQKMWTFGGTVPGPILRGHIGDTFNVTIVNRMNMPHSVDFHASQTSMNGPMKSIAPGQSLTYTFTAQYAGIFMYHCGTAPALEHIGSGMYGAVIIDPPGLAPVDHEYVLVQSELYLGPQGGSPDFTKMTAGQPDAVVFNGYWNQYKFAPISVDPHQRIRVWVIDDGPSENSSFHIVGTIFDTVYKEGAYLLKRGDSGGSQALDLMPAQGGFVELTLSGAGSYAMVSHKFQWANDGALGLIAAGPGGSGM